MRLLSPAKKKCSTATYLTDVFEGELLGRPTTEACTGRSYGFCDWNLEARIGTSHKNSMEYDVRWKENLYAGYRTASVGAYSENKLGSIILRFIRKRTWNKLPISRTYQIERMYCLGIK